MDQFVSTYVNRIDSKGRVSVPAAFREVLARDGGDGILCFPSLNDPAIDAGGRRLDQRIEELLDQFPSLSADRERLSRALYGRSERLKIDQDGRTILPERLRKYAGITTHAVFVGQGFKFQIWGLEAFEAAQKKMSEEEEALRKLLDAGRRGSGEQEGERE